MINWIKIIVGIVVLGALLIAFMIWSFKKDTAYAKKFEAHREYYSALCGKNPNQQVEWNLLKPPADNAKGLVHIMPDGWVSGRTLSNAANAPSEVRYIGCEFDETVIVGYYGTNTKCQAKRPDVIVKVVDLVEKKVEKKYFRGEDPPESIGEHEGCGGRVSKDRSSIRDYLESFTL